MTTSSQTRWWLHGVAVSAALLMMTAPAAQADPARSLSTDVETAPTIVNTPVPVPLSNAPKPDACWLSSPDAFANFKARQMPNDKPARAASGISSNGSGL
jgi:hypothetical protein